jgi:hypothetical protein
MYRNPFPKEKALMDFNGKELEVGDKICALIPDPTHPDHDIDGIIGQLKAITVHAGNYMAEVEFDRSFTYMLYGEQMLFYVRMKKRNRQSTRGLLN